MTAETLNNGWPGSEGASLLVEAQAQVHPALAATPTLPQPCRQSDFDRLYMYSKPKKPNLKEKVHRAGKHCIPSLKTILCLFPAIDWLVLNYKWKKDILPDIVSGATVAIMHIPHGIAYSMLAGVPPVIGIYMAFFPVLVYALMGTSRHLSIGTFSVICMMASKAVVTYADSDLQGHGSNLTQGLLPANTSLSANESTGTGLTPIQVAAALSFVVGMWQIAMGVLKMGVVSVLLSGTLVSGFTTGAAVHVITSQISKFFGIKLPRRVGVLKILYTYYDLCVGLPQSNLVTVGISLVSIVFLCIYNEILKPRIDKKLPIPVPIELFAVIIGTVVSYLANFQGTYHVKTIGHVSTGLPVPEIPPFWLFGNLLVDGLVISFIAFSVNMSMAKILAQKGNYEVYANQELLAGGFSNIFGSFFGCVPTAASLSRSMIQLTVGGKTQFASLVSCLILLFVLLFVGPLFEPLPNCVLASIVVVALKGMIFQVKDLPVAWKQSRADAIVWLASFLGVVLLDIDYGLGIGVAFSLLSLVILGQKPLFRTLGNVPGTQIYLDTKCYQSAVEVPGVRIIQTVGGLHFANKDYFHHKVSKMILFGNSSPDANGHGSREHETDQRSLNVVDESHTMLSKQWCLILDMSSVSFVDPSAVKALTALSKDLSAHYQIFCLANCSWTVHEALKKCGFFKDFKESLLFPTIHDAVTFISQQAN